MKFSIIVPVYNVMGYLQACIDSVFAQTYHDWEMIVIDDGSTDGSDRILDTYAENDSRCVVLHTKNSGVSAARNTGVSMATGDYVCFLDSDDALLPDALECLSKICTDTDVDFIKYGHIRVADIAVERAKIHARSYKYARYDVEVGDQAVDAFEACFWSTWAWNVCYKRSLIQNIRFMPVSMCEDICFALEAFGAAKKIVVEPSVLYLYLARPGSASGYHTIKHFENGMQSFRWSYEYIKRLPYFSKIRRFAFKTIQGMIYHHATNAYHYKKDEQKIVWEIFYREVGLLLIDREFSPPLWWILYVPMCLLRNEFAYRIFFVKPINAIHKVKKMLRRQTAIRYE